MLSVNGRAFVREYVPVRKCTSPRTLVIRPEFACSQIYGGHSGRKYQFEQSTGINRLVSESYLRESGVVLIYSAKGCTRRNNTLECSLNLIKDSLVYDGAWCDNSDIVRGAIIGAVLLRDVSHEQARTLSNDSIHILTTATQILYIEDTWQLPRPIYINLPRNTRYDRVYPLPDGVRTHW